MRLELVLEVDGEGCDRLAVDARRPGVGPDLGPGLLQVGRIGDGVEQLAHGQHLLFLSASSLAPCPGRAAIPVSPLGGLGWSRFLSVRLAWCSLRGLVSVGPFAGCRPPLGWRTASRPGGRSAGVAPPSSLLRTV
jgi:hypothetical protein